MKAKLKSLISGMLIGAMLVTGTTALAATGVSKTIDVVLNNVNLNFDYNQVSEIGENYTLDNGTEVPFSILYEGTTYLPVRKVAELFGKDVGWNGSTSTVSLTDPLSTTDARLDDDTINELPIWKASGDEYILLDDLMMSVINKSDKHDLNALVVKGIDAEEETFSLGSTTIYKNLDIVEVDHEEAVSVSNYEVLIDYLEKNLNEDIEEIEFAIRIGDKYYGRDNNTGDAFITEDDKLYLSIESEDDYSNLLYLLDILNGNYDVDKDSLNLLDGILEGDYAELYVSDPEYVNDRYDSDDTGYTIDVVYDTTSSGKKEVSRSLVIYNDDENTTYKVDDDNESNVSSVPYLDEIIVEQTNYTVINVSGILDYLKYDYEVKYDGGKGFYIFDATDSQNDLILVGGDSESSSSSRGDLDAFETDYMVYSRDYYEIDIDWEDFYIDEDDKLYYDVNADDDFEDLEHFNAMLSDEMTTKSNSDPDIEATIVIDSDNYDYDSTSNGGIHKFYNEDKKAIIRIEVDDDGDFDDITKDDDLLVEIDGETYIDMQEWADYMDQEFEIYYDNDKDIEDYVVEIDF